LYISCINVIKFKEQTVENINSVVSHQQNLEE
jgi:hypothetical protein